MFTLPLLANDKTHCIKLCYCNMVLDIDGTKQVYLFHF